MATLKNIVRLNWGSWTVKDVQAIRFGLDGMGLEHVIIVRDGCNSIWMGANGTPDKWLKDFCYLVTGRK